jgi:hypothetical protein
MAEVHPGQVIAVWFSCGAASAVAAKQTIRRYGNIARIIVLNSPIREEDDDNRRFLRDVMEWLGIPILPVINPKFQHCSVEATWDQRRAMSFRHGAPCTVHLKKEARQAWEKDNQPDWHVLGFTADEAARHQRFVLTERENVLPVLIEAGITKNQCFEILRSEGVRLPRMYELGYPNANCPGCVKATSPSYWNLVRTAHPEVFASRASQSRSLGVRLVRHQGKRIFLDELPMDAKWRALKAMPECGLFCEDRPSPLPKEPRDG